MSNRASEKIIDALTQLVEGFNELHESLGHDYEGHDEDDEDGDNYSSEMEANLVSELHAALDTVIDSEDVSVEELASIFSVCNMALEEIDPSIFELSDDEDDELYVDDDADDDFVYEEEDEEEYEDNDDYDEDDEEYDEDDEEDDDDDNRGSRRRR